jgi:hypothetical protein
MIRQAVSHCGIQRLSLTLEVHQAEGRLPLGPGASELFRHWMDLTNAERLNYWLSVFAENHMLAESYLKAAVESLAGSQPD